MQKPALETADPKAISAYPSQLCLCTKIWRLKSSWNPSDVLMFFNVFLMFLLHLGLAIYRIYRFDQLFRHRKFQPSRSETGRLLNTPVLNVFFLSWRLSFPKSFMFDRKYVPFPPQSMAESCSDFQISYPQAEEILESYRSFEDVWLHSKTMMNGSEGRGFKGWDIIPCLVDPDQDLIAAILKKAYLFGGVLFGRPIGARYPWQHAKKCQHHLRIKHRSKPCHKKDMVSDGLPNMMDHGYIHVIRLRYMWHNGYPLFYIHIW